MSFKITSIEGNRQKLDGGSMFGNAPKAVWQTWCKPDEMGRIDLACRSLLLETDNKKILFETGIGAFFEPKLADRFGVQEPNEHLLTKELNEKGIKEEDIDYVVLSHLHFDHAGGLMPSYQEEQNGRQELYFPNAKYVVGKEAWLRAEKPHSRDKASFIPSLTERLKKSNRLIILEEKKWSEFDNKIQFFLSHGHTPGQYIAIIQGEKRKLVFCGDLIPGRPWMHVPITMGYDRYPEKLIDEKVELYTQLKENEDLLFFTHDAEVAGATFYQDEKGKMKVKEEFPKFEHFPI